MWSSQGCASDWTAAKWEQELSKNKPSEEAVHSTRFLLQLSSQASEFYLGGNDSPFLLQILSAPSEQGDVDLIVTLIAPLEDEGVRYCCTQRGDKALSLCASFMQAFPEAPVLLQKSDGNFDYVLCSVVEEEWTKGPVTLTRLLDLRKRSSEEDRIAFYLPAETRAPLSQKVNFDRFSERPDVILDS